MWSKYSYTMEKLYFDRVKKKRINRLNKQIYYEYSMYINGIYQILNLKQPIW